MGIRGEWYIEIKEEKGQCGRKYFQVRVRVNVQQKQGSESNRHLSGFKK